MRKYKVRKGKIKHLGNEYEHKALANHEGETVSVQEEGKKAHLEIYDKALNKICSVKKTPKNPAPKIHQIPLFLPGKS